ncbi:MAG: FKBP-type peptidyl-prolyl cis-trans isomerase [Aquincola sp.]|nr:FKBP-type peptidyl-prolyl cis-trans isomerase [Aquincola sp.]
MTTHTDSADLTPAARSPLLRGVLLAAMMAVGAAPALAQAPESPADGAAPAAATAAPAPLTTLKERNSYATGVMTARQLVKNEVPFDLELLIQGLKDGIAGGDIRMSEKELKVVLQSISGTIQRKLSNERQVKGSIARETGLAFQESYKKKPGVTVLPGDLMVRAIKQGSGEKPGALDSVVVKYRGTLVDGTEFDATPEGRTATIKLTDAITGWREALKRMPTGSTWEIVVPPSLAYATRGAGNVGIGPNETLVFNVELVAVVQ